MGCDVLSTLYARCLMSLTTRTCLTDLARARDSGASIKRCLCTERTGSCRAAIPSDTRTTAGMTSSRPSSRWRATLHSTVPHPAHASCLSGVQTAADCISSRARVATPWTPPTPPPTGTESSAVAAGIPRQYRTRSPYMRAPGNPTAPVCPASGYSDGFCRFFRSSRMTGNSGGIIPVDQEKPLTGIMRKPRDQGCRWY